MKNQTLDNHTVFTGAASPGLPSMAGYRKLLDTSPDVLCAIDREGRFLDVSAAACRLWGYAPGALMGRSCLDFVVEADRHRTLVAAAHIMKGTAINNFENRYTCKDGTVKPMIWSAQWDAGDGVVYCVARDGSERKAAEKTKRDYEQRLYEACQLSRAGWWEWNLQNNEYHASDEVYQIFGLTRSDYPRISVEAFLSLVHPDDLEPTQNNIARIAGLSGSYQFEHRLVTPSGGVIYLLHDIGVVRNEAGQVIRVHGTSRDISEKKKAELELRVSEQKLSGILESIGDGFIALDKNWNVTYWNGKAANLLNRKREDVLGKHLWVDLFSDAVMLKSFEAYHRALKEQMPVHLEDYYPSLDQWFEISAYPSEDSLSIFFRNITDKKKLEEEHERDAQKLRQAEEDLQQVLESMSDGFLTLDRHFTITYATDKVAAMLGVNKDDYIGRSLWECFPQIVPTRFYSEYRRAFADKVFVSFEEYLPGFDLWFEVNAYPYGDELSVYVKDITGRKQQERELQISNERFQFVSMATSDVIWDWNVETGELYINQSFTRVFGYEFTEGTYPPRLWADNLHPLDRERVIARQLEALGQPGVFLWEDHYRFIKKSGETAYVTDRAVIIRNPEGVALRMVGAVQDITERRRQQQRLEFMARATSEVIWERRMGSEKVLINGDNIRKLFGYTIADKYIHKSFWQEKIHPDDRMEVVHTSRQALEQGQDYYINEYRFRKADGTWAYIKDRTYVVRNEAGQPERLIGAMEDVTRERLAEIALKESEQTYKELFDYSPVPRIVYDRDTLAILDVNDTAVQHYGYSKEEFLRMTTLDLRPAEDHLKVKETISRLAVPSRSLLSGWTHFKKNGERILADVYVSTIYYKGRLANLSTILDVTERLRLQEELTAMKIRKQQLITQAAIEAQEKERSDIGKELHDGVNQLLTTAKLYVENIKYFPGQKDAFAEKSVSVLQRAINEIRVLSKALVTPTMQDIGFGEALQEMIVAYRELYLFEVDFRCQIAPEMISKEVRLTIYRIVQEQLNNIIKYARASMVKVYVLMQEQQLLVLVEDNGVGFDPAQKKSGIGLSNIKNRSGLFNGRMSITTAPGKGCKLEVTFPVEKSFL